MKLFFFKLVINAFSWYLLKGYTRNVVQNHLCTFALLPPTNLASLTLYHWIRLEISYKTKAVSCDHLKPKVTYAGTVKRHNLCKHHVAIDTGVKQTERTIFLHVISMGLRLQLLSRAFLKENIPKLSVTKILEIISHKTLTRTNIQVPSVILVSLQGRIHLWSESAPPLLTDKSCKFSLF